jgi:phosphoserine aminotransferase
MIHNFSAGPSILPQEVFDEASVAVKDLNGSGLSILEISHRSKAFIDILDEAVSLVGELLKIGSEHKVLFLSGGASTQFAMVPLNFLNEGASASYVDTGTWSAKAIKEARAFGNINLLASSKEDQYRHIPKGYEIPSDDAYLHITTNNTVYGTQFRDIPRSPIPIVADMSSDIFSRPADINKYGLIYAGAQKNMGPAGTTLVVVREDMVGKAERHVPSMWNYKTHIAKNSSFNTPPVFPIFVSMLNLRWVRKNGGIEAMEKRSMERAKLIYEEVDRHPLFIGTTQKEDRSRMNATFLLADGYQNLE